MRPPTWCVRASARSAPIGPCARPRDRAPKSPRREAGSARSSALPGRWPRAGAARPRALTPSLADHGVVSRSQAAAMKPCAAAARAAASISASVAPARPVGDVGAHGIVEQSGLLAHQSDGVAQAGQRHVANVGTVDAHPPGPGVIESGNQVERGRFAGARGTDQRYRLAGGDIETDAVKRRSAAVIGEGYVVELDRAFADRNGSAVRGVADRWLAVEKGERRAVPRPGPPAAPHSGWPGSSRAGRP